ncbi:hypothetical protein VTK73DRAFT_8434 [Phialemonium thermophilum]|uniref:C2H2-type domain-containing protein n=1 Tax=Phialemonium thermophilum TaxID=223376 RepID=A0ABR3XPD7_9PEZI
MLSFAERPVTSPALPRPNVAPHLLTSPPYSPPPLSTMVTSGYQTQPHVPFAAYVSYNHVPPTPMLSPFKQQGPDRPQLRLWPSLKPESVVGNSFLESSGPSVRRKSRSPSAKSESTLSVKSVLSNSSSASRTITSNIPVNGASQAEFNTCVDALMKTIQSKNEPEDLVRADPAERTEEPADRSSSESKQGKNNRRRYHCDIPGCNKGFYQKTHLDIHRRAHTGDKPYVCKLVGCGQRFSQLGNLKTHERRHTGERPYICEQCGKRFAQRGNVRAHLKTHLASKPFVCKLDSCNKTFTQLGNLKSHQNKFHMETLKALTAKFSSIKDQSDVCDADRELWAYFANLYKNSNKGIKGRGKHRKVGPIAPSPGVRMGMIIPPPFSMAHPNPGITQLHPSVTHPPLCLPSLVNLGTRDSPGNGYDVYDVEDSGGSTPASAPGGPIYEDDHGRGFAFGDRISVF